MKLVKLSLIAAMATGIMATTASATPLDEVIKDVDVSGYTRLRYTNDSEETKIDGTTVGKTHESAWNFKGELNLKTKIDDNFFAVVGIRYLDEDSGETHSTSNSDRDNNRVDDFDLHRAYFGYTVGNTVVQVGRQDVGAFFTADMYGDGIKVLNSDIEGLTLAALWMDSLERDTDIGTKDLVVNKKHTTDHNLYGVAAIGSYDPVSFQVWYAVLDDVTDLFAVELATSFDVTDDVNLNAKAQYGFSNFDSKFKKGLPAADDADIYAIELGTELYGVDLTAGYVDFSTKKDKKSLVSFEDSGSFIKPGEELFDYTLFDGKNHYWFVTAGYTIPDTGLRFGVDYLDGKTKTKQSAGTEVFKKDSKEVVARIEYAHSDKLKFQTWYSYVEEKAEGWKKENDRVRFEAKYSF